MDWDKIEQLLGIGKAAAEHGPKYTPIVSAVQLELEQHLAEAKKVIEDKAKADRAAKLEANAASEDETRANVGDATNTEDEKTETTVARRV